MQRKLSLWAEKDKSLQFSDLYHLLYDKDWLRLAHDYVAQNAGSVTAGCDGIDMGAFDENLEDNLQQLAQDLKAETFEPYPVRRTFIPKSPGKVRPLGIPTIRDRIVQEALRMILEPIYEADFSQFSFGFRPNRCTMDAIKCILWGTTERKKFFWIIEGDISSYFDTINHKKLLRLLGRRVKDRRLLKLTWKFLRAGVMEGKLFRDTKLGTPQGGIISPLLANVYLSELDRHMKRYTDLSSTDKTYRRRHGQANYVYIRYADDFVALSNGTKGEAEGLKEELYTFLQQDLKLTLSKEKTKVTNLNDGFKFLGFWVQRRPGSEKMGTKILIPSEAVDKVINKIAETTDKTSFSDSANAKILALNRIIGGWCRYYQYTSKASATFSKVEDRAFWLLAHWLGRKYQLNMSEVMKRYRLEAGLGTKEYQLTKAYRDFPSLRYAKRFLKSNPYTTQEKIQREELLIDSYWTGHEARPGMADLRPLILERDGYICQRCGEKGTPKTLHVDHIRPVRRFKRPVDANVPENLQTLHIEVCHRKKTQEDRQRESRVR